MLPHNQGVEIIVAVLDGEIDIKHKVIKDNLWENLKEIPNNNIDDDNNKYVDDVNGWNFLGNSKGEMTEYSNLEYTRIVKKYKPFFHAKLRENISADSLMIFDQYISAKDAYTKTFNAEKEYVKFLENVKKRVIKLKNEMHEYSHNGEFSIASLEAIETDDVELKDRIRKMLNYLKLGGDNWQKKWKKNNQNYFDYYLNMDYNDREIVGDDVNNINNIEYGNNKLFDKLIYSHATEVAGVLFSVTKPIKKIKIMPLITSCNGDEHDKDIALAIRYAVNNGAKIINITFGKGFSQYENWILDAIKYAERKNVLIVSAAGNEGHNVDFHVDFPNDTNSEGEEISNNYINVGASNRFLNNKLLANFTCYGKKNVDVFAPGVDIYTSAPNNKYMFDSGTSLSTPIVSGIAALVWSHYPNLKAHEIKEIIMESGVSYDIDVEITNEKGEKVEVPFNSLSKSGKIVNAYNALLMAKNYKKWKKGKWPKK